MIYCRLTPNEKLPDRFLFSGVLKTPNASLHLAYIIEITKPWFPTSRVAPIIINELKGNLSALSGSTDLLTTFENTLKNVNEALFNLSEQGETEWIGNLNSLIILIKGSEIHLSQAGSMPGYLFRKQKINQITEGLALERESHPLKTFSSIISGQLEDSDRILIANHELFNVLSLDMLRQIIVSNSPYQSSLMIRRSLKKHHVPTVSSIILNSTHEENDDLEPDVVVVEEGFERWYKKAWRIAKPKINDAVTITKDKAKKAHEVYKHKVSPKIKAATKKSLQATKSGSQAAWNFSKDKIAPKVQNKVNQALKKDNIPEEPHIAILTPEPKVDELKAEINQEPEVKLESPHLKIEAEEQKDKTDEQKDKIVESQEPAASDFPKVKSSPPITNQNNVFPDQKSLKPLGALSGLKKKTSFNKKPLIYILIACLLIIGGFLIIKNRQSQKSNNEVKIDSAQQLNKVRTLITEAETAKAAEDQDTAIAKLTSAKKELTVINDENQKSERESLSKIIQKNFDEITNTIRFESEDKLMEFSDDTIDRLSLIEPYLFVSSKTNSKIYRQAEGDIETAKQIEIEATPSITRGIIDLFAEEVNGKKEILAVSGDGVVYQIIQNSSNTQINELKNPIGKFATADTAASYYGNLYLLDGTTGLLWKYTRSSGAFSKGVNQVDINTVDLKKSISIAIDGYIYILKEDGSVIKLLKGIPENNFKLQSPPKPDDQITKPIRIITSIHDENLYILDAGITNKQSGRLLEYSKNGDFIRQYALPGKLNNIKDASIDTQEKILWVLSGKSIYTFELP